MYFWFYFNLFFFIVFINFLGAPVKPKLASYGKKLYDNVEKAIRKNIEEEMRVKAGDKKPESSKAKAKKKSWFTIIGPITHVYMINNKQWFI